MSKHGQTPSIAIIDKLIRALKSIDMEKPLNLPLFEELFDKLTERIEQAPQDSAGTADPFMKALETRVLDLLPGLVQALSHRDATKQSASGNYSPLALLVFVLFNDTNTILSLARHKDANKTMILVE